MRLAFPVVRQWADDGHGKFSVSGRITAMTDQNDYEDGPHSHCNTFQTEPQSKIVKLRPRRELHGAINILPQTSLKYPSKEDSSPIILYNTHPDMTTAESI
ncbi:uncharacterized protein ARMOST_11383 [Armillaria ostoyae]|uniref:Uncharacterized protein n=1 Tax=Armillaria ostoyae TaxID=47428 RepID=A0A284RGY6_ARMOS|nr:uncharacterized protein ARMOST_11383 [Armillaria ostoyae]